MAVKKYSTIDEYISSFPEDIKDILRKIRGVIIRRRGNISDGDGNKHPINVLEIHHKDRNTDNNDPRNLRVLTKKGHDELHRRASY